MAEVKQRLTTEVEQTERDPFVGWQAVDVQFPSTPHSDYVIRHGLTVDNPKDVHYRVIKQFTSGTVYEASDAIWTHEYVVLRSDVANWTGRLLLGTLAEPAVFDQTGLTIPESVTASAAVTTLTGDVTGTGQGTVATTIADQAVGLTKLANVAGPMVLGRESGTGSPESISIGEGLTIDGGVLKSIINNVLTTLLPGNLLGRNANTEGTAEAITLGNGLSMIGGTLYFNNQPIGLMIGENVNITEQLYLGEWVTVNGPYAGLPVLFGLGAGDTNGDEGVVNSLFRAVITADDVIDSVYKPVPIGTSGEPEGRIIVIWNDSAYNLTLHDNFGAGGSGGSGHSFIAGDPVILGPQGMAVLSYVEDYDWGANGIDGAWIVVSHSRPGHLEYTPVWSATTTPPTMGNTSLTGVYTRDGDQIIGRATVIVGASGWSDGTGQYTFTLPVTAVTPANAVHVAGTALIWDTSTSEYYTGTLRLASSTTVSIIPDESRSVMAPANPITLAAGDQIGLLFAYKAA